MFNQSVFRTITTYFLNFELALHLQRRRRMSDSFLLHNHSFDFKPSRQGEFKNIQTVQKQHLKSQQHSFFPIVSALLFGQSVTK